MKTPRGISALGTLIGFIFLLILLGVLWVSTGGPSRAISHSGPFLTPPTVPLVDTNNGQASGGSESQGYGGNPTTDTSNQSAPSLLDYFFGARGGITAGAAPDSPYASEIRLDAGNAENVSDPAQEYIAISVSQNAKTSVTITGWSLKSTINQIVAPLGSAAAIPTSGDINQNAPITLSPGQTAYVVTGRSPNGVSFRTNMCTGYFAQHQSYSPSLRSDCPSPSDEALRHPDKVGTGACIDFVRNLSTCQIYTGTIPDNLGSSCVDFIQNDLTYAGCVATHRNDPSFYGNEWRIFLNRQQELWATPHDQITLLDENGKVVASINY